MTRTVAARASAMFVLVTALMASVSLLGDAPLARAMVLVGLTLCVLTGAFAAFTPERAPVPVRIRRRR